MPQPAVRCTELVEVVTDWMEGALTDGERVRVEEHLAICPHCTEYVAQLRRTIEVLGETPRVAPPHAALTALVDAFRNARG